MHHVLCHYVIPSDTPSSYIKAKPWKATFGQFDFYNQEYSQHLGSLPPRQLSAARCPDQTPKQCYGRLQRPEPDLRLPASRCDGILELNLNVNSDDFVCPSIHPLCSETPIPYSASHPKSNSSVHQPICFWLGCQDHRSLGHYLLRVHVCVCVSVFRWYVEGDEECLESKYCGFAWFWAHLMISPPITHRSPKAAAQGLAAPKVVQGHALRVASGAKGGIYIASIQRYVCRQGEVQLYTVYHSMTRTNRSM